MISFSLFQFNALQQNSDVPMITHVFDPLKDAMVTMTVETIQMNGIAEVNLMHKYFIVQKIVLQLFSILQFHALQHSSDAPMIAHVFNPQRNAMVTKTVGTIQMKIIVQDTQYIP